MSFPTKNAAWFNREMNDDPDWRPIGHFLRAHPAPDADHPDAMECPMCDYITLVPAEDENSTDWSCEHCGCETSF